MKQRTMRKVLSWALALAMLLTMLPIAAFAEEVPLVGAYAESEEAKFEEKFEAKAELAEAEAELFASSETLNVSSVSELQSAHPYNNNMDNTWIYTHPTPAAELSITFSADTETESRYDYIYIYDGSGSQIGKYDGTTLAGQTMMVSGNVVKIRLTSDGSQQRYGFRVTSISATEPEEDTINFAGGNGTENNPYLIETAVHLNNVRNYLDAHFKMTADIVFTSADFTSGGAFHNGGKGWTPIGSGSSSAFTGTFDGDGHTIIGLKQNISSDATVYSGLFGYVSGATIENLGMEDTDIRIAVTSRSSDSTAFAGGIVGYVDGSISNCYNTGAVTSSSSSSYVYAGGIAGYVDGSISNCYNTGAVTSSSSSSTYDSTSFAGGIAGYVDGDSTISECHNTGEVTIPSSSYYGAFAGGIAGYAYSNATISKCYNTGAVTAESLDGTAHAGGIAGMMYSNSIISECYNTGAVTSSTSDGTAEAGGIAGSMGSNGTVSNCYNTGVVTAESSSSSSDASSDAEAGGIAGSVSSNATISECYNTGAVTAGSSDKKAIAGGIAGSMYGNSISECYNTGAVTAESLSSSMHAYAGGIAGYGSAIRNCYNIGSVTAESSFSYAFAGGIAGYVISVIRECYNIGAVTAESSFSASSAGGIAGYVYGSISECYNIGAVTSSSSKAYAGGIGGYVSSSGSSNNCYYLDTSNVGVGSGTDTATKCTAEQMKLQATYAGFDFTNNWTMAGNEDYLYPEIIDVPMIFTKKATSIAITTLPTKLSYTEAMDSLDVTNGKVTIYYDDSTSKVVDLTVDMVSGFDNTVVGKQELTVTYEGFTTTFEVEIVTAHIQLSVTPNVVNDHIVLFVKSDKEISTQVLHIALYSEAGQMLDYIIVPTIEPFTTTNVVFDDDVAVKTAKVFLWDSLATTTPIADAVEVTIR